MLTPTWPQVQRVLRAFSRIYIEQFQRVKPQHNVSPWRSIPLLSIVKMIHCAQVRIYSFRPEAAPTGPPPCASGVASRRLRERRQSWPLPQYRARQTGRWRHESLPGDGIALANRASLNRTRGRNGWIFFTADLASGARSFYEPLLCVDNFCRGTKANSAVLMSLPRCRHDIDFPSYVEVDKAYNPTCPPPSA